MTEWKPILLNELYDKIQKTEKDLNDELGNFWQLIKIDPVKWAEQEHGVEGDGFWVVAILGTKVVWYNDVEDGFNISNYKTFGHIEEYYCNQDELIWTVTRLFDLIKFDEDFKRQAETAQNLK